MSSPIRFSKVGSGEGKVILLHGFPMHHHVGNTAEVSNIVCSMMRRSISAGKTCAIKTKVYGQVLDTNIVNDLVVSALHERAVDVTEWNEALFCETGRKCDRMLFSDTHIKSTIGHLSHHDIHR